MTWLVLLCWLLTGCTDPEPVEPSVDGRALSTEVSGPDMSRIDILNADGLVIAVRKIGSWGRVKLKVGARVCACVWEVSVSVGCGWGSDGRA